MREELPQMGMVYTDTVNYDGIARTPVANEKHSVSITQGVYGYRVDVGCQQLSVSTSEEAIKIVSYYLSNRMECIKAYAENRLEQLVNIVLKG